MAFQAESLRNAGVHIAAVIHLKAPKPGLASDNFRFNKGLAFEGLA